jgi:ankyrin repeat protein
MDLCEASKKGDKNAINLLINCGQDINIKKTIFGTTPLYSSVVYCESTNKIDPAKILLENGAEINTQDVNGWTSFHKAC